MQTTEARLETQIAKFIAENFLFSSQGFPYAEDASLLENGVIDSMNVLQLVMFVEEKFKVTVEDDEILPENFDSVANLANFVRRKM